MLVSIDQQLNIGHMPIQSATAEARPPDAEARESQRNRLQTSADKEYALYFVLCRLY